MIKVKRFALILGCLLIAVFLSACGETIQSIQFETQSVVMQVNTTMELSVAVTPTTMSTDSVVFSSSNTLVASIVENKLLLAKTVGTARIFASSGKVSTYFDLVILENQIELQTPTGLRYNEMNGRILWNAVEDAVKYEVKLNGTVYETAALFFDENILIDQTNTVQISAVGLGTGYAASPFTEVLTFSKLATPQGLVFDKTTQILSWTGVSDVSYCVSIDGTLSKPQTQNSYQTNFATAGTHELAVVAFKNEVYSTFSSKIIVQKLGVAGGISVENNKLLWNSVSGATSYSLTISSQEEADTTFNVQANELDFSSQYIPSGPHTVKIVAKSSVATVVNGSESLEFSFDCLPSVSGLTQFKNQISWSEIVSDVGTGEVWYSVVVSKGGVVIPSMGTASTSATTFVVSGGLGSGNYVVQVYAYKNGTVSTEFSQVSYTLEQIAVPTIESFNYASKTLTVSSADLAQEIVVKVGNVVQVGVSEKTATGFTFVFDSLSVFSQAKIYDVTVQVSDEISDTIIPSNFSASYTIEKLAAPEISMITDLLSYTRVARAVLFDLYLSNDAGASFTKVQSGQNVTFNFASQTAGTYQAKVVAVGNGSSILTSADSTVFTNIVKLSAPLVSFDKAAKKILLNNTTADKSVEISIVLPDTSIVVIDAGVVSEYAFSYLESGDYSISARTLGSEATDVKSSSSTSIQVSILNSVGSVAYANTLGESFVTFNSIENADSYNILVNDIPLSATFSSELDGKLTYDLGLTNAVFPLAGEYVIKVYATSINPAILTSAVSQILVTRLAMTSNIAGPSENGLFSWDMVNGASAYEVVFDTSEPVQVTSATITIADISLGEHSIFVTTVGDDVTTLSSISAFELVFEKIDELDAVQSLAYTNVDDANSISFVADERMIAYDVYVDDVLMTGTTSIIGGVTTFVFDEIADEIFAVAGLFEISVVTNSGNQYILDSDLVSISVVRLGLLADFTFTNSSEPNKGTIDWENAANNNGYEIYLNGSLFGTTLQDVVSANLTGLAFGDNTVSIRILGNEMSNLSALESLEKVVAHTYKLLAPNATFDKQTMKVTVSPVTNANAYTVKIGSGSELDCSIDGANFSYTFTTQFDIAGSYTIYVKAKNTSNANIISSDDKTLTVTRLTMISGLQKNADLLTWTAVIGNNVTYSVVIGTDEPVIVTNSQFSIESFAYASYTAFVKAVSSHATTLDSLTYCDALNFEVREKIAATTNVVFTKKSATSVNYKLEFDAVEGAASYKIYWNDLLAFSLLASGTGTQTYLFEDTYFEELSAGRHTVYVVTVPESGVFLDESLASSSIVIEKLSSPTGLTINTSETISFTLLDAAISSGYEVVSIIDTVGQGISYSNLSDYDGTIEITVKNLGVSNLFIDSDEKIFVVTRLTTPTTPYLQNDIINWTNSSSASGTKLTIKQNSTTVYENTFANTVSSYNYAFTSSLVYEIFVQHMVTTSQSQFLTSRVSLALTATKLATPTSVTLVASGENQEGDISVSWTHDGIGVINYSIYVNDTFVGSTIGTETTYVIPAFPVGTSYQVKVAANGDNANGYLTSVKGVASSSQRLAAPTQVQITDTGYLTWNSVTGAIGYKIEIYSSRISAIIPSSTQTVPAGTLYYDYASLLVESDYAGSLEVRILAVGNSTTLLSSVNTLFAVTKINETSLLATDSSIITTAVGVQLVKLYVLRGATNVELSLVNRVFNLPDTSEWGAGTYEFSAVVLPATQTNNIIRSKTITKTVTRLAAASVSAEGFGFNRNANPDITTLSWTTVTNAIKYELVMNEEVVQASSQNSMVLGDTIPVGDLSFSLVVYGTTGLHFASRKTSFSAFKLSENFGIRNESGIFTWDFAELDKANALKISVTKGVSTTIVQVDTLTQTTDSLAGLFGQLQIKMRALGNVGSSGEGLVVLDGNYSSTTEFNKLAKPENLKSTNGVMNVDNSDPTNLYDLKVMKASNPNDFRNFDLTTYYLTQEFDDFILADTEYFSIVNAIKTDYLTSDSSDQISFKVFPFDSASANFRIEKVDDYTSQLAWDFPVDEELNPIDVGGFRVRVYYDLFLNDDVYDVLANINSFSLNEPNVSLFEGEVYFQLSVVGTSSVDGEGVFWLSSKFFGNELDEKLTSFKLSNPDPGVEFGTIAWDIIQRAAEHRLFIIQNSSETQVYSGNEVHEFELASLGYTASETENIAYSMYMVAIGNGVSTLSSTHLVANNKSVVQTKTPGEIVVQGGGLRFENTSATDNYSAYTKMDFPTYANFADFNPCLGFVEIRLVGNNFDRSSYLWPQLLTKSTGSPFASMANSNFKVAIWHDGIAGLTYDYTSSFALEALSSVSYIGIDDLFPGITNGTYTMTYRQMGDNTNLLTSKYSTSEIFVTVLDSVNNVRIIESSVDGKPYLTWSASTGIENAGASYVPIYQVVAYNYYKEWWDCLYETTDTSVLIDNTTLFGGVGGITYLYTYHKKLTVIVKGNTSGNGLVNYISSPREELNTLSVSVLTETQSFGVETGILQWSIATNPISYLVKYTSTTSGVSSEYSSLNGPQWDMASVAPGLYSIVVQAIGNKFSTNGSAIINGKPSETKKFYKLQAPSVSINWGYFTWNQVEVASSANNIQFISTKYIARGSLNASTNFSLLNESSDVNTIRPTNSNFGTSEKWKMEYITPAETATYFKFQAYGSASATDSGAGFVSSDTTTIENNVAKYRLPGFASTEIVEILEGKLVWTRKDTAPCTNYYWLEFTKLGTESTVVVNELVQLPVAYSGDASKVEYELTNSIDPGSWKVVVKNTNINFNLNSLASLSTEFVKLRNISGENVSGGFVNWDPVTWDIDDTTGCSIIIEFEDPTNVTNKYQVRANPDATVLNESTVLAEYADILESIPVDEWKVSIKTGKASQETDLVKVVDSVWKQIGTVPLEKLGVVTTIEKSEANIVWTAPDQEATYNYKLKVQRMNETTKEISNIETTVSQPQYTPDGGYSVMSIRVQTIPTSGTALASSWSETAIFTALSAPPTAVWNALLKGFELRIPLTETVPTYYQYSIIVQFKATGTYTYTTNEAILQNSTEAMYFPMQSGTYKIAYAIVVGGVVGEYQHNATTGEMVYCTEQSYTDFGAGNGTSGDPFTITRNTTMTNIQYRSWAYFSQTEGTTASPVVVSTPIASQSLWASRTGNTIVFSAISAPFTGSYQGNGKVVQLALTNNTSNSAYVGMFEKIGTGAVVTNFTIKVMATINLTYKGQIYIGILAGQIVNHLMTSGSEPNISLITIALSNLSINYTNTTGGTSATIYYGSIAGNIDGAVLTNCTSNLSTAFGSGNARSYFAGLVGLASSDTAYGQTMVNTISKCVNNGAISASVAGGLVCNASLTKITQSANKGTVTSSVSGTNFESSAFAAVAGGLIALANRCEIEYSYNRGTISIYNSADLATTYTLISYVGGLVARAEASIVISSSYNSGSIVSDTVNNAISKRGGYIIGFAVSTTPSLSRVFYMTSSIPSGVTEYILGVSKSQAEMQASSFVGVVVATLPSTHYTVVSGNFPKLTWEP